MNRTIDQVESDVRSCLESALSETMGVEPAGSGRRLEAWANHISKASYYSGLAVSAARTRNRKTTERHMAAAARHLDAARSLALRVVPLAACDELGKHRRRR